MLIQLSRLALLVTLTAAGVLSLTQPAMACSEKERGFGPRPNTSTPDVPVNTSVWLQHRRCSSAELRDPEGVAIPTTSQTFGNHVRITPNAPLTIGLEYELFCETLAATRFTVTTPADTTPPAVPIGTANYYESGCTGAARVNFSASPADAFTLLLDPSQRDSADPGSGILEAANGASTDGSKPENLPASVVVATMDLAGNISESAEETRVDRDYCGEGCSIAVPRGTSTPWHLMVLGPGLAIASMKRRKNKS